MPVQHRPYGVFNIADVACQYRPHSNAMPPMLTGNMGGVWNVIGERPKRSRAADCLNGIYGWLVPDAFVDASSLQPPPKAR